MFCWTDKHKTSSPVNKTKYTILILLYLRRGFKRWITDVKLEKTGIDGSCIEQMTGVKIAVDVPSERDIEKRKGATNMSSNNNSSGKNQIMNPNARDAMNQFKMEAANDQGASVSN